MPLSEIHIEWMLSLGDVSVAAGTLLLALVTWSLAKSTARSVEALDLPFVIATSEREGAFSLFPEDPDKPDTSDVIWTMSLKLKNIGAGPAIVDGVEILDRSRKGSVVSHDWTWDTPISPGEETINQAIGLTIEPPDKSEMLVVRVSYRSASANRYVTNHEFSVGRNLGLLRRSFERQRKHGGIWGRVDQLPTKLRFARSSH